MLTTVQELEREIEQFYKNIKESNELMNILLSVVSLTKTQTESFEVRTKELQDELAKLSPELGNLFQKKIEGFVQSVHEEHQSYQVAISELMEGYADKFVKAESSLVEMPSALAEQLHKDREENVAGLKKIQEQYVANLIETNEIFAKQLQAVIENIQVVPSQIQNNSDQQYSEFLKKLENMIDARFAQLSDTEKCVVNLSQQLEAKYDAFITKLEATNMDQLYKYYQDMNKSIHTKLGIVMGGVGFAVIVSIIALFI